MKELQKVTLAILIVGSSLVAMAAADPTMGVTPQPVGIATGETFVAEVTMDLTGAAIYAAEYRLSFDPTILKAIEQTQGTFLCQGGTETIVAPIPDEINNTKGIVQYAETRVGDPATVGGATESGILASVTFEAICDDGTCGLNITKPKLAAVFGCPDDIRIKSLNADDIDITNGPYTIGAYPSGDLNHDYDVADAIDATIMIQTFVEDITL